MDAPTPCCAVGARPDAADIEAEHRSGVPLRAIERARGVPYTPLRSHLLNHVQPAPTEPQSATIEGRESPGSTAKEGRTERTVLLAIRKLERRASRLLRSAERGEQGIDYRAAAALAGQVRGALELEAKLLGAMHAAKPVPNRVQQEESFAAAWRVVRGILDAKYPGAAEHVEAGLTAWEEQGGDAEAAAKLFPDARPRFEVNVVYAERPDVEPLTSTA